ncbi:hypothetical protein N7457_005098 [Penicillium paradoxum]|uniref:uncharacterized protein n=1 Tax=Penicillium paradoxum TaxID=176176 RepID=UPI0025474BE1|nr:uncharacterized protein N7457_005098 [Penicillium paradoxum]KAJ5779938.1 hypothetical protein N7457_005098 [Penicillium paradoxum]
MGKDGGRFGLIRQNTFGEHARLFSGRGDARFVTDLRRNEMKRLTDILHLDITRARHADEIVKCLIHALPKNMRRDRWSRTNKDLCNAHQDLSADLIYDLFNLIRREVGYHLRKFDAYPHLLKPLDNLILKQLRAIQGMWKKPSLNDPDAPNAWRYEISDCQGCMVARIASDKNALRNLRVALLARTQTRVNHVPRRLMKFVDACIDLFPDDVDELYGTSSQFAYILKDTRKACSKAWLKDPAHVNSRHPQNKHSNREKGEKHEVNDGSKKSRKNARSHTSANEYNPRKNHVQPPRPIKTPHPAERYVPESSSSFAARRADSDTKGLGLYRPTSRVSRKASTSPCHMSEDHQWSPNPDRVTRFMDFADDNYQGLGIRAAGWSATTIYGSLGKPRSPSAAIAVYGTLDEANGMLEM